MIGLVLTLALAPAPEARDPFVPYAQLVSKDERALDDLVLKAVVSGATPLALVEDRTGRGRILRVGSIVGKAQVTRIDGSVMVVRETMRTWDGRILQRERTLRLSR